MPAPASSTPRLLFRRAQRLTLARQFQGVYAAKASFTFGSTLRIHSKPNGLAHCRLGLSVGKQVGGAVVRNRVKRHLREAFRLEQREFPMGLDLVINVRPHEELPLSDYRLIVKQAAVTLAKLWAKRAGSTPS